MKKFILILLMMLTAELFAQTVVIEESELSAPVYLRPVFQDSTLLFFNDTMIWTCHHSNNPDNYYYPISKTHFNIIDTCVCHTEKYVKTGRDLYSDSGYRLESKKEFGRLIKISENMFEYSELDPNGVQILTDTLIFNVELILRIDSAYTEDLFNGGFKLEISKFFEVKNK